MTDRDESEPSPADKSGDRSLDPTEMVGPDTRLSNRDALIAGILRRENLVEANALAEAEAELSGQNELALLDLLVDRGHLTDRARSAVESMATVLAERGASETDQSAAIGDTVSFPSAPSTPQPAAGNFGDYEILAEIAKGGMGVVYKARQTKLNRTVALKMIRSGELADQTQVDRFYAEAEAAAKLEHPNIVPVYEVGRHDGQHFYSMGFVDGQTLHERVKQEGPLAPETAARLIQDAARAVHAAHEKGVIHRDIKPHNILVDTDGQPKITDFGLAKMQQSPTELTATGQVLGTPAYMPPEQAAGKIEDIDMAADVYSLGATLYFLLVGRAPFETASIAETIRQVIESEPVSPRKVDPSLPRDLETICLKCLRKEIPGRYATAQDSANDLGRWLDGKPIVARRVGRAERAWKWCKRKPAIAGLLAAILMLSVVGSVIFWERSHAIYAAGLLDRLRTADPNQVNEIVNELPQYQRWSRDGLQTSFETAADPSPQKLHAALGLLSFADPPLEYVQQVLLSAPISEITYVGVICDALGEERESTVEFCWERLHDSNSDPTTRFRAGLALAHLVGPSDRWTPEDHDLLVDQLVRSNAVYQPEQWRLLERIKASLIEPLEAVYLDAERSETEQVAAANALGQFLADDGDRLTRYLLVSNPAQFNVLYPALERAVTPGSLEQLSETVAEQPTADLLLEDRIALGRRRAKAAIMLLRHGSRESIFDVMRYREDPEAMTQFIHRCRSHEVPAAALVECLEITDRARGRLDGNRQKVDDSVVYALLLALGDYPSSELFASKKRLVSRLAEIYARDPSSAIHSASGWLLRKWGYQDEVTRVDQTALAYDETGHREWYVLAIECTPQSTPGSLAGLFGETRTLYFTMIVFPSGSFEMGSPAGEQGHQRDEVPREVQIERPFAVCDRELTWLQTGAMQGDGRRQAYAPKVQGPLDLNHPSFSLNWFETVGYCVWLTEQADMSPAEQCYVIPAEGNSDDWSIFPERPGFRHLTEPEWEYVCRSGTTTAYSFGEDVTWLEKYAWYVGNAENWCHPVAELRPNPRGLFDIHGNFLEWCYDWYPAEFIDGATANSPGMYRIYRGGGWDGTAGICRSANRAGLPPANRSNGLGFRLAATPSSREPEAQEPGSGAESEDQ